MNLFYHKLQFCMVYFQETGAYKLSVQIYTESRIFRSPMPNENAYI